MATNSRFSDCCLTAGDSRTLIDVGIGLIETSSLHLSATRIVVMGVSGSGKSTLGAALAAELGCRFIEGDQLHPQSNIAKMKAGIALRDEDRWPFLERVAQALTDSTAVAEDTQGVVVSCSALKRSYRDFIRARAGAVTFVLPVVDRAQLSERLARRTDHFMPAALLDSQFADLQPPDPDEDAISVDGSASTAAQVAQVSTHLRPRVPEQ